jgi:hypothetical protein
MEPLQDLGSLQEDPENCILIVLGETLPLEAEQFDLDDFVNRGGAVLLASDRNVAGPLRPFGLRLVEGPVDVAPNSAVAYKGLQDCIFVVPTEAGGDLFRFQGSPLTHVATNRAGWLRPVEGERDRRLPILARFPSEVRVPTGPFGFPMRAPSFAAGGPWGKGRVLVLSDHSVFINAMLWQTDNSNLDFATNCMDWLRERKRQRVLFLEEGTVRERFDIPLKNAGPPPLPPVDRLVQAVNGGLQGMEEENRFNEIVRQIEERINHEAFLKGLAVVLTIGLAVYGLGRLGQARHRLEPGAPLLADTLSQAVRSVSVLDLRQRAMLRDDNYWEAAHALARQGLEAALAAGASSRAATALPPLQIRGTWRQRWALRRQMRRLWRLAHRTRPRRVTAVGLRRIRASLAAVHKALADGTLRMGK